MNGKPSCICDSRPEVRCGLDHCDLAGPGAPGDPSQCRICYIRLGGDPSVKSGEAPPRGQKYSYRQRQSTSCLHLGSPSGERPCKLCGNRGTMIATHHCGKHGTCSVQNHIGDGTRCCLSCEDYRPMATAKKIILRNHLSPGDVLAMSAALECLHAQHPGKFLTAVDTTCPDIWQHNPHVWVPPEEDRAEIERAGQIVAARVRAEEKRGIREPAVEEPLTFADGTTGRCIQMHYPLIHQSGHRPVHFLQGYVEWLRDRLGVPLELTTNRPHLYLSDEEKGWKGRVEEILGEKKPYWVICSGVKHDFTAKGWGHTNYQNVVWALKDKIQFVQVGASEHMHPMLEGVIDQVGKTSIRELIRLVYHADGVLCGTTFLMHVAAALERPAIVVAGGREPKSWNTYPRQMLLSTAGQLSCCVSDGCWRSRTVPLRDGDEKDKSLCEKPVFGVGEAIPKCMAMIRPQQVVEAILDFYEGGILSPDNSV